MRIRRSMLYPGLFLAAVGLVLVAADLGSAYSAALADVLRLWPFALIALGAGLILRRTQVGLPAGMLAAAVPGLVLGGALAVAPRFAAHCGARGDPAPVADERGRFDGPATVAITTGCGSLRLTTAAGAEWRLEAASTEGRAPRVQATARSLTVDGGERGGWRALHAGRDDWTLTLPTGDVEQLSLVSQFGRAVVDLPGASIGRLAVTAGASRVAVDASEASVADLSAVVNVGALSVRLPAGSDLLGTLRVGGGELRVCAPPGLGLSVTTRGFAEEVRVAGLRQTGSEWQSPDYTTAAHRADLTVIANIGSVEINPIGGCT